MSNLNNRALFHPRFRDHAAEPLGDAGNCVIDLLDMNLEDDGTAYNWQTNAGGYSEPTVLMSGVVAQLQVYRFTLTVDAPAGSVDQTRSVRFVVDRADAEGIDIRKGQMIRVLECENDESLTRYQYTVNSGLNGGWALKRTIETEVDMARVVG
jgi:hypothetical protein